MSNIRPQKIIEKGYKSCQTDICKEFAGKSSEEIQQMQMRVGESQGNELIKRRIANTGQKLGKSKGYRLFFGIRLRTNILLKLLYFKRIQKITLLEKRISDLEALNAVLKK